MSSKTSNKPLKEKNKVHTDNKSQYTDASSFIPLSSDLDNETMNKINKICSFTNRSKEEAYIALQDFNGDDNQAAQYLLENDWQERKKKKRPQNSSQPFGNTNSASPNDQKQLSGDGDNSESPLTAVESSGKSHKENKSGQRFRKGHGQQNGSISRDRNDDNQNDSQERNTFNRSDRGYRDERSSDFDSSRGRRLKGQSGNNRRGGRSNRGGSFHGNVDSGSTNNVEMWNNSLAENGKMETIATWGDTHEDWNADAWEGSLEESLVLTRTSTACSSQYNPSLNHRQHKTFQTSPNVYYSTQDQNASNQSTDYNQDYLKQYNQEATMRIKSAVGIGVEPSTSIYGQRPEMVALDNRLNRSTYQNAPSQRSLLPPPSRIPQSAVEMPGSMNQLKLDVQFGNWDSSFTGGQVPSASDNMDSSLYSNSNNRRPENRVTSSGGNHNHPPSSTNPQLDLSLEALRLNAHSDSLRLNQESLRSINSQQQPHPDAAMFHDESILESKHSIEKVTSQSNTRLTTSSSLGQTQNSQYPFDASAYSSSNDNKRVNPVDTSLNHYYDSINEYQQYDSVPRSFKVTGSSSARELSTNIPIKFEGPMSAREFPVQAPITSTTKPEPISIENPSAYSMYQSNNSTATNYLRSSLSSQSDSSVTMTTSSLATISNQAGSNQTGVNLNKSNQPTSMNPQTIPVSMTMHQSAGFHGYGIGVNYTGEMYSMGMRGQQGIQGVNKLGNQLSNSLHIQQQHPAFQMNNLYGQMNPNMYRSSEFDSLYNNNNRQQRLTDNTSGQQFTNSTEQQVTSQNTNSYTLSSNNVPTSKTPNSNVLVNTQSAQNNQQQQSNLSTQGLNTQGLNVQQTGLNTQTFNTQSLNTPQGILNSQALNTQGNLSTSQGALNLQQGNLNGQGLNSQLGGLSASGLSGGLNMASTKTSNATTSTGSKLSTPNQLNQMLNPNYVVNQPPGFHMAAYHGYPHAPQTISGYAYEELQLQQQRFPASQAYSMHTGPSGPSYYDMAFQQGREGNSLQGQTFTGQLDTKLAQLDNSVSGSMGSGLPTSTNQQQFHLNPHYGYYYPGNIVPVQSYYPAVIPMGGMAVPVATNQNTPQHAGSTTQFQNKQNQFASHNFNLGGQSGQDFAKNLGQQASNNIKTNSSSSNQTASVTSQESTVVANSATHNKQVQNSSLHHVGGGVQVASQGAGTQGSSVGVFNAQSYLPHVNTQMLHAGLQQDNGRTGGAQPNIGQPMKLSTKSYASQYWPAN